MSFFNIISVVKGEDVKFVWQSQTIKVTNIDNKIQIEKEIRKYIDFYAESSAIYRTVAK